jgi:hypothetical protein
VRSVKHVAAAATVTLTAAALGGCYTTTQQTSDRLGVKAQRVLASQKPLRLGGRDHQVRVVHTSIVRGGGTALIAVLRNTASQPVSDLPLAAGVRKAGGGADYVNLKGVPYFQAHTPAIPPGGEVTWVLSGGKSLPAGTAVATIGRPKGPIPAREGSTLPRLDLSADGKGARSVRASVTNTSGIPQYGVEVYAWARKGGRFVAAGRAELAYLGGGDTTTVHIPLVGNPKGAPIHLSAPPTIFQ